MYTIVTFQTVRGISTYLSIYLSILYTVSSVQHERPNMTAGDCGNMAKLTMPLLKLISFLQPQAPDCRSNIVSNWNRIEMVHSGRFTANLLVLNPKSDETRKL